ncbi:MAG: KEOPS complex subunit Cgi121 [Candidatus Thorarchaeota archaeon]
MIVKEFNIGHLQLKYFVGITQVRFELNQFLEDYNISNEESVLNYLFKILEEFQNKYEASIIQLIKDNYILNLDHLFIACYFLQKALYYETLISNKKNIELLLYLSTHRQINKSIKLFGLDSNDLKRGTFILCIISPSNNIESINNEMLKIIRATEINITIDDLTLEKIEEIIKQYDLSELQIKAILNSYGVRSIKRETKQNIKLLSFVIFDLICERMALLNVEKGLSH